MRKKLQDCQRVLPWRRFPGRTARNHECLKKVGVWELRKKDRGRRVLLAQEKLAREKLVQNQALDGKEEGSERRGGNETEFPRVPCVHREHVYGECTLNFHKRLFGSGEKEL